MVGATCMLRDERRRRKLDENMLPVVVELDECVVRNTMYEEGRTPPRRETVECQQCFGRVINPRYLLLSMHA